MLDGVLTRPSFWGAVASGLWTNLLLTACALSVAAIVGVPLGIVRAQASAWVVPPLNVFVALIRATPLLMLILWTFLLVQAVLALDVEAHVVGALALSIYAAVGVSDIVTAGARSVPLGSVRAAKCLGLSGVQIARCVVAPMAMRAMLPALASFSTTVFKDSSMCYIIGVSELMQAGKLEATRQPGRVLEIYAAVGVVFLIVCIAGARLSGYLERRFPVMGALDATT
jgi:polar amino acid transport system permease protein